MALAPILRTTTVTTVNPTPPTNVVVNYQGSPPTLPGLAPVAAAAPDVTAANFGLFKDPINGAVKTGASAPTELQGLAEGDGSESVVYYPAGKTPPTDGTFPEQGTTRSRGVGPGTFTETPNGSHPSYGT